MEARQRAKTSLFLPDDITVDIISRLPVKSVIRFKSVSTHWLSLIRSPNLISTHLRYSSDPATTSFIIQRAISPPVINSFISLLKIQNNAVAMETPFPDYDSSVKIAGCCDGAICFTLSPSDHTEFLLWNPATRESKRIPQPLINLSPLHSGKTLNSISVGFSFDRYLNEYKLVRVVYFNDDKNNNSIGNNSYVTKVEVFTRSTNSWREIIEEDDAENIKICVECPCVVMNGMIYWEGSDVRKEYPFPEYVISFDVHEDRFRKILMPMDEPKYWSWGIFAWKDSLAVVFGRYQLEEDKWDEMFDVWRMNYDSTSSGGGSEEYWTKMFSIGPFLHVTWPIAVGRDNGKAIMQTAVEEEGEPDSMKFFDLNSRQLLNTIQVVGAHSIYEGHDYVESLVTF